MECNKDEAIRAKEIAERKMQSKDFPGARKFVLRAQHLYGGLDNITQMLLVCDVHCASEKKISNESDWYNILQVEPTTDEASIRKQYRKSALLLHPDKNKFPGAEAAFKLVGEAQRVLLDRGKRSIFDMKLKASRLATATVKVPQQPTQVPTGYAHSNIHNNSRAKFGAWNPQEQMKQKPTHQGVSSSMPTFWTMCPHCRSRYKYYLDVLQKAVRCHNCPATFTAYAEPTNLNQTTFNQQKPPEKQSATVAEDGCQGNTGVEKPKVPVSSKGTATKPEVRAEKVNGKRKRTESEDSSESIDTESSSASEEDMEADVNGDISSGQNIGSNANQDVRRSVRHKQQVSYRENVSDDEDLTNHPEKAKGRRSSSKEEKFGDDTLKEESHEIRNQPEQTKGAEFADFMPCNGKDEKKIGSETDGGIDPKISRTCSGTKKNVSETGEVSSNSSSESAEDAEERVEQYICPEPEFNDFEKDHKEGCFSVGQIWALYDDVDAMPRFYGRIKRVFSPGFKVQITWLEPENEPEDDALPVSSGNFKAGDTDMIDSHLMFSHPVSWEKGPGRNIWRILPREGEIWALFKNWDTKLESNMKTEVKFEYEFVEVLSNYSEDAAIRVAYLAKVKGFISVFCRSPKDGMDEVQIAPHQLFRFSHQVPSYKLTGEEREGVPRGSFELDPASLPASLVEADARRDLKAEATVGNVSNPDLVSSSKLKGSNECISVNKDVKAEDADEDKSNSPIPIPEAEFYDFDADKSPEKFKAGQIWAMYSDEDALPKYYVEVKNVEIKPAFKLQVRWLSMTFNPSIQQWQDEDMPSSCGRFKVKGRRQQYDSTAVFSHLMKAEGTDKKDEYDIFPQSGEVWALYRNWNTEIKCSELENCEYEIVEVLNRNDMMCTKVILLERVNDYGAVFKPQIKGSTNLMRSVRLSEMLRFSHQIPAFRLTDERDGSLRGFWELDPAALPEKYFKVKS